MPRIGTGAYAREVAQVAFHSPQFSVPERPALRPEVVVAEVGGGLVFDGGPQPFAVPGALAVAAFRRLLPCLDGTATVAELAAASGLGPANIETLLGLLVVRALVQDGPAGPVDPAAVAFSRGAARTGARPDAAAVAGALRLASVAVVGEGRLAEVVAESLRGGGLLGAVVHVGPDAIPATTDLVLLCAPTADIVAGFVDRGIAVVGATLQGPVLWCGPWLDRSSGICAPCYAAALPTGEPPSDAVADAAAQLLATTVLHTLGRFGRAQAGTRVVRTDLAAWRTTTYDMVCPQPDDDGVALVRRFEAAASVPPRDWLDPAIHRVHYEQANIRAQTAFRRAPGDTVELPEVLSELLRHSVGVRTATGPGASPDRSAASAGNLGSTVAYCLLRDHGVCQYDPEAHELVRIDAVPPPMPDDARAVVMLTADLGKLGPKYGLKAYRLAWLDAGYALGQLHVAAAALGVADRALDAWDDAAWRAVLGPGGRDEVVCGGVVVNGLGRGSAWT